MGSPELALSVRQPWAWAIIHGGKDIENRSWQAVNHGLKMRGRIVIHAAKGMTQREYESARHDICHIIGNCPRPDELIRGAIIGTIDVVDVVSESDSPWFFGPRGLVLENPNPLKPLGLCLGQLGYFKWRETDQPIPSPLPWMKAWPNQVGRTAKTLEDTPLFPKDTA